MVWQPEVYPRVCGGTFGYLDREQNGRGLSPRVRGNRGEGAVLLRGGRSIPACAGEPGITFSVAEDDRVYPRVCGGTVTGKSPVVSGDGLSPRVRGNLGHGYIVTVSLRSIPACAGEPDVNAVIRDDPKVYPRVCGGTPKAWETCTRTSGLSPRVRGNLKRGDFHGLVSGSIPACAGEPLANVIERAGNYSFIE